MPVGFFFSQLKKLGKQLPDQILPAPIRTAFQEMWASNGDAISRQYAGTAAMKVPRGKTLFPFISMHLGIVNMQPRSQNLSSFLPLKRGTRQTLRTSLINIRFL